MMSNKEKQMVKIIATHLKAQGVSLSDYEINQIDDKQELLDTLRKGKRVEFEWTVIFSMSIFDETPLGAESWIRNNESIGDLNLVEVKFNPSWQTID